MFIIILAKNVPNKAITKEVVNKNTVSFITLLLYRFKLFLCVITKDGNNDVHMIPGIKYQASDIVTTELYKPMAVLSNACFRIIWSILE